MINRLRYKESKLKRVPYEGHMGKLGRTKIRLLNSWSLSVNWGESSGRMGGEEWEGSGHPCFSLPAMPGLGQMCLLKVGPLPHQMLPPPEILIYIWKKPSQRRKGQVKERKKEASTKTMERGEGSPVGYQLNVGWGQLPGFPGPTQIYLFLQ